MYIYMNTTVCKKVKPKKTTQPAPNTIFSKIFNFFETIAFIIGNIYVSLWLI